MLFLYFSTALNLTNETKRWVVIGCVLQTVLSPVLRKLINLKLQQLYFHLNLKQKLKNQSYKSRLKKDNDNGAFSFNYDNINQNNVLRSQAKWNYSVTSHHDLAKLYLKPHMATFSCITDESFDTSAALSVITYCCAFPLNLQDAAASVRDEVRNPWGHCNITEWTEQKFNDCFVHMDNLIKELNLPHADEVKLVNEIKEWKKNGKF